MNILIRVDASTEIGTGHVMRCLTLADLLREKRAQVFFICQELEGHLCGYIEAKGYQCTRITDCYEVFEQQNDALETVRLLELEKLNIDIAIIDHYQIDYQWEQVVRKVVPKIMVIDDLANRKHDCDLLLDQNYYENFANRYDNLVPLHCIKLLGPRFLILRPEFQKAKQQVNNRTGKVERILIFFGGSDPTNETEKCLLALNQLDLCSFNSNVEAPTISELGEGVINLQNFHIDVVVGTANPNRVRIEQLCQQMKLHYHCQIDYLAELMARADVSIGAGGITMWERMYVGLPSLTVIVADNQHETVEAASKFGAVWSLGWHNNVKVENYVDNIRECLEHPGRLREISKSGMHLIGSENKQMDWIAEYLFNH